MQFTGLSQKKKENKFLTIDKSDSVLKKYDQVFSGIKHHINKTDDSEVVYNTNYDKIKFSCDDSIPLNKLIYYPQVYLGDCLYQI